ncbi:MAG: hypothetical protein ACLS36_00940 [Streptococcus sp.]
MILHSQARTMGQNGAHLKFKVKQERIVLMLWPLIKVIYFKISTSSSLELAVTLSVNVWNGQTTLSSC